MEVGNMITLLSVLFLLANTQKIGLFDSLSERSLVWDIKWSSYITHFDIQEILLSPFIDDIFFVVIFESLIKCLFEFGNWLNRTHLFRSNLLLLVRFTIDQ